MKINDVLHNFTVTKISTVEEISATAVEMEYKKNGCKLLWLDRPDDNKTFAITFKTIPWDNTGVFHILEHSVLCGSDKYPLKEPFVDLLKSSMQTFLNAMTFLDKTMYPVSSRNDKDLLNLMDVYMDAVFNPLIHSKKEIFMQEGWHIEENEEGEWFYNGVVYNEMRGVFSSVDSIMVYKLLEKLFPDSCYGCESGGAPKNIPDLTYEKFTETHKKFYHPSNATIVLDGEVNLDEVLPLIDSYLCKYDREEIDFDVQLQAPVKPEIERIPYEVSEGDDALTKTEIAKGFVYGDYTEQKKNFAMSILCDILAGTNDSPLKKALFEKGLAEDVYFSSSDDTKQRATFLVIRGVPQGREAEVEATINKTIAKLAEDGIPEDQLVADINITEFALKEQDFGSEPAGLIFAIKAQETWLHGGDPTDAFRFNSVFSGLRESLGTGYYEELLRTCFLDNPHQATIYMVPDETLSAKNEAEMKAFMADMKANISAEDKAKLDADNDKLKIFRETPDTPELSALVPHLELSDISEEVRNDVVIEGEVDGVKILTAPQPMEGIEYLEYYFDISDFDEKELWAANELSSVLSQCRTEEHSSLEFATIAKTYLGSLSTGITILSRPHDIDFAKPCLRIGAGALCANESRILPILSERMFSTIFDESRVLEILKQDKLSYETSLKESGNRHAGYQVKACLTRADAAKEICEGETDYKYINYFIEHTDELVEIFGSLMKKMFSKQRATVSLVGKENPSFLEEAVEILPSADEEIVPNVYALSSENDKKIKIASDVAYAAKGVNVYSLGYERKGEILVATSLLSLEYLWNEVRVKGGAYGCSCGCLPNGNLLFSSFRDPNPDGAISVYNNAGKALRELTKACDDISKYIIGTISSMEPVQSSCARGKAAILRCLNGVTNESRLALRKEILSTTKEKLIASAEIFDKLEESGATCVVG